MSPHGGQLCLEKYRKMRQNLSNGILKSSFTDVLENKTYKKMIDACFIEYILNACNVSSDKNSLYYRTTDVAMRQYLAVTNKYAITPIVSKVRNLGLTELVHIVKRRKNHNLVIQLEHMITQSRK